MYNERERKRLNELFSGIEVLAVNPAGRTPDPGPGTVDFPARVSDSEMPVLGNETTAVEVELGPAANLRVGQLHSDPLSLYEQAQMRLGYSSTRLESPRASTLTLPGISKPISSPLKTGARTTGRLQLAPRADGQSTDAEWEVTDSQAVGIGLITGLIMTGVVLAVTSQMDFMNTLGRLAVIVVEVLFGIMGALAAQSSRKNRRAIWTGAITWVSVPVVVAVLISLIVFSLLYTSFLGV